LWGIPTGDTWVYLETLLYNALILVYIFFIEKMSEIHEEIDQKLIIYFKRKKNIFLYSLR